MVDSARSVNSTSFPDHLLFLAHVIKNSNERNKNKSKTHSKLIAAYKMRCRGKKSAGRHCGRRCLTQHHEHCVTLEWNATALQI